MSNSVFHWAVEVRVNHETVLTIESNSLCGKSELTEKDEETIRLCAEHLLSFVGRKLKKNL